MSSSVTVALSFMSDLFARNWTGIAPVTRWTAAIQSWSSWSVSLRVMSQTARTPCAPWKYASLRSSRNPFSPMMSQIVMSIAISPLPFGSWTTTSFFDTFAPSVEIYRSSNWSWTNRRIRHVFPTAPSPTRQILTFIFWRSIPHLSPILSDAGRSDYKGVPSRLSPWITRVLREGRARVGPGGDRARDREERLVHASSRPRRRQVVRGLVHRAEPRELLLGHDDALREVALVPEEDDWHAPDLLADHRDPAVQVVERILPGDVAHGEDGLRALEVRVAEEGAEALLAHDVPDHHVEGRGRALPHDVRRLLRDLRAHGRDVAVVEGVRHEPLDQGGLPDGDVADEADLRLDVLRRRLDGGHHRHPRDRLL